MARRPYEKGAPCYEAKQQRRPVSELREARLFDTRHVGQGGIVAVEWRGEGIQMWQFGRTAIPTDIKAGKPDPSAWPVALADFPSTNCDIGGKFRNASIVANIDVCGDAMPERVWGAPGCPTPLRWLA
ncbi:hypothetical protein B0H67DRAFT_554534 [Lasiosphaeris hirsuta]|uniref:Uncharacterized protein n=1 Tax=Lasiosphaeris hirsuta TaxID=260670 RepID=A0AA40AI06_9PEZI|nr:hypothetical protein B0H67DRAFT_554534 [Lasiosphaeris hirsuta]